MCIKSQLKYTVTCTLFLLYGCTSCDYIGGVTSLNCMNPRVMQTRIRLGICSVSMSDKSPRGPHDETCGPYLPIAKCCGFLRKMSRNFADKSLGEISEFYFSPRKTFFRARGVPRRNAKKRAFFLGLSVSIDQGSAA